MESLTTEIAGHLDSLDLKMANKFIEKRISKGPSSLSWFLSTCLLCSEEKQELIKNFLRIQTQFQYSCQEANLLPQIFTGNVLKTSTSAKSIQIPSVLDGSQRKYPLSVTELDLTSCVGLSTSTLKQLLSNSPHLKKLILSRCVGIDFGVISDELKSQNEKNGNHYFLNGIWDFSRCHIPQNFLKALISKKKSILEKLISLNLHDALMKVDKSILKTISTCSSLTQLNLSSCGVCESLSSLEKLPSLTSLNLADNYALVDTHFGGLNQLWSRLKELNVTNNYHLTQKIFDGYKLKKPLALEKYLSDGTALHLFPGGCQNGELFSNLSEMIINIECKKAPDAELSIGSKILEGKKLSSIRFISAPEKEVLDGFLGMFTFQTTQPLSSSSPEISATN